MDTTTRNHNVIVRNTDGNHVLLWRNLIIVIMKRTITYSTANNIVKDLDHLSTKHRETGVGYLFIAEKTVQTPQPGPLRFLAEGIAKHDGKYLAVAGVFEGDSLDSRLARVAYTTINWHLRVKFPNQSFDSVNFAAEWISPYISTASRIIPFEICDLIQRIRTQY